MSRTCPESLARAFSPEWTVEAAAWLFSQPPFGDLLPHGWQRWKVARKAHSLLAKRFLTSMPSAPTNLSGRGVVMVGGDRYSPGLYVGVKMLRRVGYDGSIQIWHRGADEPVPDLVRKLPGVTIVDSEAHPLRSSWRTLVGWTNKLCAVLNCGWQKILYLDSDCFPCAPVENVFDATAATGFVIWPDLLDQDGACNWSSYGLKADGGPGWSGGQWCADVVRAWPALQLAHHYDMHADFYMSWPEHRVGSFGDQGQLRAAFHRLRQPATLVPHRPHHPDGVFVLPAVDGSGPQITHLMNGKLTRPGEEFYGRPPRYRPELPGGKAAWSFFQKFLKLEAKERKRSR